MTIDMKTHKKEEHVVERFQRPERYMAGPGSYSADLSSNRRITQTTNLGENLAKAADLFNFPLSEEAQMALERTAQALDIYRKARKEVTVLQNTKRREQRAQIDRDAEAIERALMEGFNPQLAPDKVSKLEADIIREERRVEAAGRVVVRMARAIRDQFEDEPEWWNVITEGWADEMAFDLEAPEVTNAERKAHEAKREEMVEAVTTLLPAYLKHNSPLGLTENDLATLLDAVKAMPAELPTIEEHLGRTRSLGGDLAKLQGDDLEASPRLQAQLEEGAVKVGKSTVRVPIKR